MPSFDTLKQFIPNLVLPLGCERQELSRASELALPIDICGNTLHAGKLRVRNKEPSVQPLILHSPMSWAAQ